MPDITHDTRVHRDQQETAIRLVKHKGRVCVAQILDPSPCRPGRRWIHPWEIVIRIIGRLDGR